MVLFELPKRRELRSVLSDRCWSILEVLKLLVFLIEGSLTPCGEDWYWMESATLSCSCSMLILLMNLFLRLN